MFRPLNSYFRTFVINKRRFHTNNCLYDVYESPRSGYPLIYDEPPITKDKNFLERLKIKYNIFKDNCKLFGEELWDKYYGVRTVSPYEENVMFKFDGSEKSLKQWIVNYDAVYNEGFSTAKLELSPYGTGIFHGVLNTTVPKDGRIVCAGYCNITTIPRYRSFGRKYHYDWTAFNQLVLRVRGDGRCYMINLLHKGHVDITWNHMYNYFMYTRGGPYWQVVTIPFSKFLFSAKGIIQDNQFAMPEGTITNVGITVADKKPGPFRLEIDYIAVRNDECNFEKCAYELLDVSKPAE